MYYWTFIKNFTNKLTYLLKKVLEYCTRAHGCAGMIGLPFAPSPLMLALFWPLTDANISNQLPKSHKMACKAYRYEFFQKRSAGMFSRWPRKCQYAILVHTVTLRALFVQLIIRYRMQIIKN